MTRVPGEFSSSRRIRGAALCCLLWWSALGLPLSVEAAPAVPPGFTLSLWAREPMLRDPVAISVDDLGRVYVVETARRSTVDIDIRSHPSWIVEDLSNQSVQDLRQFFRRRMAPELSLENASWLRDYNGDGLHDWRDLESIQERVSRLEDTRGAGKADRAQVIYEGFHEEITGVIAGVLPWEDQVWVTVYPDLWKLSQLDAQGRAQRVESVFQGFGVHAAFDGHDLHGLTVGPEGKIYFSIGDNGFSVTNREGRWLHYPNTGGVLRMDPDGSNLEVFAMGLRNPQEIAFDEFGNLFSVDNDGDLEDERERFVYITEGSDSGWRLHWQFGDPGWAKYTHRPNYNPWIAERMWVPAFPGQPAHITPPLTNYSVGPGGFKYNPGTALTPDYARYFFLVQFPVQKLTAFQAKPKGAAFEMVNEHVFLSGMMASALNFAPDGSMVVADWDGMWAPDGKGAVWRIDAPAAQSSPARLEVQQLLREGMSHRAIDALQKLLGHSDQRIRQRAQFELVRRREEALLLRVAQDGHAPLLARVHALWGLNQSHAHLSAEVLPFQDPDPEVRAQVCRLVGDLKMRSAASALIALLKDSNPRVQFYAAVALGKVGDAKAVGPLVELLQSNADRDAFLRHAAVMGLSGIGDPETWKPWFQNESRSVRLGLVVALRRLRSPLAAEFLLDVDPGVRLEAVRAVHDDRSIPEAIPTLASLLNRDDLGTQEGLVRRVLNANLRLGTEEAALRLVQYALDLRRPEPLRSEAVQCLGVWHERPHLDRVEGLLRPLSDRADGLGDLAIQNHLSELLLGGNALRQEVVRLALEHHLEIDPGLLRSWVRSEQQSPQLRAQALDGLALAGQVDGLNTLLDESLESPQRELRQVAMRLASQQMPRRFVEWLQHPTRALTLPETQWAIRLAGGINSGDAARVLSSYLDQYEAGTLVPALALDVLEACRRNPEDSLKSRAQGIEDRLAQSGPAGKFKVALTGGDPAVGREVFRGHVNAQCVRCHDAGGEGQQAGPVLAGIGKRVNADYLLEALIDPSARIAEGFQSVRIETRDGDGFEGTLVKKSPEAITLRMSSGEVRTWPVQQIARQSLSTVSAMPPMGEVLSRFEIRDLIAYLSSLK